MRSLTSCRLRFRISLGGISLSADPLIFYTSTSLYLFIYVYIRISLRKHVDITESALQFIGFELALREIATFCRLTLNDLAVKAELPAIMNHKTLSFCDPRKYLDSRSVRAISIYSKFSMTSMLTICCRKFVSDFWYKNYCAKYRAINQREACVEM